MKLLRRVCLRQLVLAGAAPLLVRQAVAQAATPARAPLRMALSPFLSPGALLASFEPMRQQLQSTLAQPVEFVTSRDLSSLMAATRRVEHDVVQLPGHLARLVMLDWGWQVLAEARQPGVVGVIVAVKDSGPVRSPADLRGQRVAMLEALSFSATAGRRWLREQGLTASVTIQPMPSLNSLLYALDRDEVAAFVAGDTQMISLPPGTPRGERVLARIEGLPGPVYLARPSLPAADVARLSRALQAFRPNPARPPIPGNGTLEPVDVTELKALDVYAETARQALGDAREPSR